MDNFIVNEELNEFVHEVAELLEIAEYSFIQIENGTKIDDVYDAIYRSFCTIKGGAGMLGLEVFGSLIAKLENELEKIKGQENIPHNIIGQFLIGIDLGRRHFTDSKIKKEEVDALFSDFIERKGGSQKKGLLVNKVKNKNNLIYIIDDEEDILGLMKDGLDSSDVEVKTFLHHKEFFEAIKERKPSLILTDFKMPEMNGLELLEEVKKIYPDLPVVMISGFVSVEVLLDATNKGIYSVLEKPFRHKELVNIVSSARQYGEVIGLLNKSLNIMMYQFSDLCNFLNEKGRTNTRDLIHNELKSIMIQRNKLRNYLSK